ncbi:PAS domain S-box protein [Prosthecodimorpha staleyi]|uniref:histidine kinase n=1 Tax=Prosthecodimorpha staleyi TaxID=2840188 RepID=A0A947D2H6_9HYPH|nr:PAS domain S-box protein [Prosthecodimorpha staleyi]MBT9288386.1 PAS domain S-box protein [Prosthecodimorpha staleyi]
MKRADVAWLAASGVFAFVANLLLTRLFASGEPLPLWVGDIAVVALLAKQTPASWPIGIPICGLAQSAGLLAGGQPDLAGLHLLVSLPQIAASLLGLHLLRTVRGEPISVGRLLQAVVVTGIAVPAIAGLLEATIVFFRQEAPFETAYLQWVAGSLAAASTLMPLALLGDRPAWHRFRDAEWPWAIGLAGLVSAVAWIACTILGYPFIFVSAALILAACRLSPLGTSLVAVAAAAVVDLIWLKGPWITTTGELGAPEIAVEVAASFMVLVPTTLSLVLTELRNERQRLIASNLQIENLIGRVQDSVIYRLDVTGRIEAWGNKTAGVFGYTGAEVIGRHYSCLFLPDDRVAGLPGRLLAEASDSGRVTHEQRWMRKGGEPFWGEICIEAVRDGRGIVTGFSSICRDLSELHRSRQALALAEQRWSFALESASQGVWDQDRTSGKTYYSPMWKRMLGYAEHELTDDMGLWLQLMHPDDRARAVAADDLHIAGGSEFYECEFRMRHRDGRWLWMYDRGRIIERDGQGRPTRMIGTHTDITERKLTEDKFRLAVEACPAGIALTDGSGKILLVNAETERMFGYAPDELVGAFVEALVPEAAWQAHADLREGDMNNPVASRMGAGRDLNGVRKDGSTFPVELGLNPIASPDGLLVLGVISDITDRKRAEIRIAESEARYRMIAENLIDLVVQMDLNLVRTYVSPASIDILGLAPEEMLDVQPWALIHPDDCEGVRAVFERVRGGCERATISARYRHKDGRWVWIDASLRLMREPPSNEPIGILIVARDVTRAREAEAALRASEETFRDAMQWASIGMALVDTTGKWLTVNTALCGLFGYAQDELMQTNLMMLSHPDDIKIDLDQQYRLMAEECTSYQIEKRYVHKCGATIWTQQSVSLARGPDRTPRNLIVQLVDITGRKEIDQLKGEFISTVSHELRTPLTSIRGSLGLVLGTMVNALPARAAQLVEIAHKNSERLLPLINDILDLDKLSSGLMRFDMERLEIAALVEQAAASTKVLMEHHSLTLRQRVTVTGAPVIVDAGRFIQVLTNLLSNAAKFSPRDATVEIAVERRGSLIRVSVSDQGPGIPDEFRSRIFTRFSQADSAITRKKGGSGLGLHISKQLIERMDGSIGFESEVERGTTFWIDLPLAPDPGIEVPAGAPAADSAPTILALSRDEAMARFLAAAIGRGGMDCEIARRPGDIAARLDTVDVAVLIVDAEILLDPDCRNVLEREIAAGRLRKVPTVVVTAEGTVGELALPAWRESSFWLFDVADADGLISLVRSTLRSHGGLPRILHITDDASAGEYAAAALAGRAALVRVDSLATAQRLLLTETFDLVAVDPAETDEQALSVLAVQARWRSIPLVRGPATHLPHELRDIAEVFAVHSREWGADPREETRRAEKEFAHV